MTLLVAGLVCALALATAGFSVALGKASTLRARAQIAADAAALAAAAESGPYGEGRLLEQATTFARANGARLLECWCRPGATAVEVRVAVQDVVAQARAVLDVALLEPRRADSEGLHPVLRRAVERLVSASGGSVVLVSGFRSEAEQRALWLEALRRYGDPERADDWVAPPGRSMHERGLAVDLGGDVGLAISLIDELGLPLHRPLSNEPWHFELKGSRGRAS